MSGNYIAYHKLRLFAIVCSFFCYSLVQSQSDNYWSWNFNTPSVLLAGSVVGGNAGASSVFYNPSLIDNDSIPSLSISANVLSLQFFKANNIAGEGIDADKFIFKVQPRFVSYLFPTKSDKFGVEAAILSPVSEDVNFTVQHTDEIDVIQRTLGLETYDGYLKYSRKYEDIWVGAGFSYELSENWSIGASSFLAIKTMKYIYQQDADAYQETDSVRVKDQFIAKYISENKFKEEIKYWDLSFVFKLGGRYKTSDDRLSIGANITLPNLHIYGEGDLRKSAVRSNIFNNDQDLFVSNEASLQAERKVRANVKSPFSFALGLQYFTKNKKNFISLTSEYFHEIDPYSVVSFSTPNDAGNIYDNIFDNPVMSYTTQAKSVTNVGIGWKQFISPSFFLLGGFRTDFTVAEIDQKVIFGDETELNRIHLDKYHFSVGPVFSMKNFKVITGVQYTYGRNKNMQQIVSFTDPVEYIPALDQSLYGRKDNSASASLNEIALFLGVTVGL
ncbi:hypothetical protein QWY87_03165 [Lutimonas halocynthiae]|uniref:hypothetical protein n=1 Tax=Lutimonas halocynthiae TaxID=1446477 RepID=UPI0025B5CE34|nr:hypothetical protein [Lutimonas halocynthiae]MDN3641685.1 hypothetical protein [Lutimonas halocynthiae]